MAAHQAEWESRLQALWASVDDYSEDEVIARIEALAAELPEGSAIGAYERASAQDWADHPDRAAALYREALRSGLPGERRRCAVIQLASSLRNLGRAQEGVELLEGERTASHDALDDAVSAFLALALADLGREREALAIALTALGPHLPLYQRSIANYAHELTEKATS